MDIKLPSNKEIKEIASIAVDHLTKSEIDSTYRKRLEYIYRAGYVDAMLKWKEKSNKWELLIGKLNDWSVKNEDGPTDKVIASIFWEVQNDE